MQIRNRAAPDLKKREPLRVTLRDVRVNHEGRMLIEGVTLHTKDRPLFPDDIPEGCTILFLPYSGEVLALLKDGEAYDGSSKLSLPASPRTKVPFPTGRGKISPVGKYSIPTSHSGMGPKTAK